MRQTLFTLFLGCLLLGGCTGCGGSGDRPAGDSIASDTVLTEEEVSYDSADMARWKAHLDSLSEEKAAAQARSAAFIASMREKKERPVDPHYNRGYERGYDDGFEDARCNERDDSYNSACRYRGRARELYQEGYHDGYDDGFDDGYYDEGGFDEHDRFDYDGEE